MSNKLSAISYVSQLPPIRLIRQHPYACSIGALVAISGLAVYWNSSRNAKILAATVVVNYTNLLIREKPTFSGTVIEQAKAIKTWMKQATKLDCSSRNLKELSACFAEFQNLETLDLSGNPLNLAEANLPIWKCKKLKHLDLRHIACNSVAAWNNLLLLPRQCEVLLSMSPFDNESYCHWSIDKKSEGKVLPNIIVTIEGA